MTWNQNLLTDNNSDAAYFMQLACSDSVITTPQHGPTNHFLTAPGPQTLLSGGLFTGALAGGFGANGNAINGGAISSAHPWRQKRVGIELLDWSYFVQSPTTGVVPSGVSLDSLPAVTMVVSSLSNRDLNTAWSAGPVPVPGTAVNLAFPGASTDDNPGAGNTNSVGLLLSALSNIDPSMVLLRYITPPFTVPAANWFVATDVVAGAALKQQILVREAGRSPANVTPRIIHDINIYERCVALGLVQPTLIDGLGHYVHVFLNGLTATAAIWTSWAITRLGFNASVYATQVAQVLSRH